jgi:hypothetical protein
MEFYSVVTKKKIQIPDTKIKTVTKKGRRFAVGSYIANGKSYEAWRVLPGLKKVEKAIKAKK